MNDSGTEYTGRFAPSPTGPLHAGSLIAALGSFVDARAGGGRWLLRIDDLDPQRTVPGTRDDILRTLECHGLHWDGDAVEQSTRGARYVAALDRLAGDDHLYRCICSRREIARTAARGPLGHIYPGTCRNRDIARQRRAAVRLALPPTRLTITDRCLGPVTLRPGHDVGDVVVRRRDGIPAYHLATAIDDADLGVTHVVRGADLLPAALVQSAIVRMLGLPILEWRHLPLARTANGAKLSKQTGASPIDRSRPVASLLAAWAALGQVAPPESPGSVEEFHQWAIPRWNVTRIPAESGIL